MRFSLTGLLAIGLATTVCHADEPPLPPRSAQPLVSLEQLLLFFPLKHPHGNWSPEGLEYTDVEFSAQDGIPLHGWYCPCPDARATIDRLVARGAQLQGEIQDVGEGILVAEVLDPFGNRLGVIENRHFGRGETTPSGGRNRRRRSFYGDRLRLSTD